MPDRSSTQDWLDKLEIRELIERSVRHIDDGAGDRLARLFAEDGVLQLAGTVFEGRSALRNMFGGANPRTWTEPGELLKQPASTHLTSNPIIDVDGDTATAETDMVTVVRDDSGRSNHARGALPRSAPSLAERLAHRQPHRRFHRPSRGGGYRRRVVPRAGGNERRRAVALPSRRIAARRRDCSRSPGRNVARSRAA
jgi:hypothetical protein